MRFKFSTLIILLVIIIIILITASCSKNTEDVKAQITTGGGGGTVCLATKTAAENIQVFPSDNPWNNDISASPIDPYNTQIIAAISSPVIKADFGSGRNDLRIVWINGGC